MWMPTARDPGAGRRPGGRAPGDRARCVGRRGFLGRRGSTACQEFITQLGRNFQVIYEQANAHGQKVQTAGSNMNSTDSAVGSSWASA